MAGYLEALFWESVKDYQDDPKKQAEILHQLIMQNLTKESQVSDVEPSVSTPRTP